MQEVKPSQTIKDLHFPNTTYFRGLLFTRIEDHGPDITANFTTLDEGQVLSLAVQAFTLIGVGTGSRSSGSWVDNIFGPMPVPTGQLLNSLIYPFLTEDQTSTDARIRSAGRSCAIIVLVSRQMKHYDELRDYLLNYFASWAKEADYTPENIKQLLYTVQKHATLKVQETEGPAVKAVVPEGSEKELQELLMKQNVKISLLEHLVSLDSIGQALVKMYEADQNGGTLDQLAKMTSMSRIMLNWNLRKYVKSGLIQLENGNIYFLK